RWDPGILDWGSCQAVRFRVRWVGGEYEDEVKTGPERIVASVLPQLDLSVEETLQACRSV
ncbi:hypothetical protein NW852_11735, partial [Synechococcus sp. H60.1]